MEHEFSTHIQQILNANFGEAWQDIYDQSPLLQYLNIKTKSAARGAKARGSFANLYAVYVLVEDYLKQNYHQRDDYSDYEGARFTDLFQRQRELPFGSKLQNHALNSRMNEEFRKYFPQVEAIPILRDVQTGRYWINENLLKITLRTQTYNIAHAILAIIKRYVEVKRIAFDEFLKTCERLKSISTESNASVEAFVMELLAPHADARIFEIVSYAILKLYYHDQTVYFGYDLDSIQEEPLVLYKTGRTNANDGGIDFVMRPVGRLFQVTETLDVRKYFLDIDKIERYPITFVIKSLEPVDDLRQKLQQGAERRYPVKAIIEKYMHCVEEIINISILQQRFREIVQQEQTRAALDEIILQSKVEFGYEHEVPAVPGKSTP